MRKETLVKADSQLVETGNGEEYIPMLPERTWPSRYPDFSQLRPIVVF
jgi:hypothetical protein